MQKRTSKIISVSLAVFLFIIMNLSFYMLFQPKGPVIDGWSIVDGKRETAVTVPFTKELAEPRLYHFKGSFEANDLDRLVLGRVYGYAVEVRINDQFVGQEGSLKAPASNIWNSTLSYSIQHIEQLPVNRLDVKIYGIHDVGITTQPYLANESALAKTLILQHVLTDGFALFLIGAMSMMAILLLYLSVYSKEKRAVYGFFALSNLSYMIYNLEFVHLIRYDDFQGLLVFRKITMVFLLLAMYCLLRAVKLQFGEGNLSVVIHLVFGTVLGAMLFAHTLVRLDRTLDIANVVFVAVAIYAIILAIRSNARVVYFSSVFLSLGILQSSIISALKLTMIYNLNYTVFIFIMGLSLSIVIDFSKLESKVDDLSSKVTVDALTRLYNRSILEHYEFSEDDVLMFIDLNDFKAVNDTYGHDKGDEVLRQTADIIGSYTRDVDLPIRYAGDEFVIIYHNMSMEIAEQRARILSEELLVQPIPVSIAYGLAPMSDSLEATMAKADQRMYARKEAMKTDMESVPMAGVERT